MDLTRTYPRSVREKFGGIVQLGRTTDKARAKNAGSLGEYHYNCPMDEAVFAFLGIDHEAYLAKVAELKDDKAIEAYIVRQFISKKTPAEIEAWNQQWLIHGPDPGSNGEKYFLDLRQQIAPGRTDVTSWPDLLDLEEGRPIPVRKAA